MSAKGLALLDLLLVIAFIVCFFALFVGLPYLLERRAERRRLAEIEAVKRDLDALRRTIHASGIDDHPGGPLVLAPDEDQ